MTIDRNYPFFFLLVLVNTIKISIAISQVNFQSYCPELVSISTLLEDNKLDSVQYKLDRINEIGTYCSNYKHLISGELLFKLGNYDSAILILEDIKSALKGTIDYRDSLLYISSVLVQSTVYLEKGDLVKSKGELDNISEYIHKLSNSEMSFYFQLEQLVKLGNLYYKYRDGIRSVKLFKMYEKLVIGSRIIDKRRKDLYLLNAYNGLGRSYSLLFQPEQSLLYERKYLEKSIALKGENNISTATVYFNMVGDNYLLKKYDTALLYLKKALSIFENFVPLKHPLFRRGYNFMGQIHLDLGNVDSASYWLDKSGLLSTPIAKSDLGGLKILKNYYAKLGNWEKAVNAQQARIKYVINGDSSNLEVNYNGDILKTVNPQEYSSFLIGKSKLLFDYLQNTKDSTVLDIIIDCYLRQIETVSYNKVFYQAHSDLSLILDDERQNILNMIQFYELTKNVSETYSLLQNIFKSIELNKAYSIHRSSKLRYVYESNQEDDFKTDADSILSIEKKIKDCGDKNCTGFLNKMIQLKKNFINNFYENSEYSESVYSKVNDVLDLKVVQQKINRDDLILEYFDYDDRLYLITISRENSDLHYIPLEDKLKSSISKLIKNYGNSSNTTISFFLYENLISNHIDPERYKNIFIIPSEALNRLNFGLLNTSINKDSYLIKSHSIGYGYSVSSIFNEFPASDLRKKENIALYANSGEERPRLTDVDSIEYGSYYYSVRNGESYLPGVEKEISILKKYGAVDLSSLGVDKQKLFENVSEYDLLHFATHAFIEEFGESEAYLVLGSSRNNSSDDFLKSSEIERMNLTNCELVFLSACNTGSGKYRIGEGALSLAYSFKIAGAKSVIMTLWKIPDETTPEIVGNFYKHLKDGKRKSEALRLAKLEYLENQEDPLKKHPFFWAGFVLVGDDSPVNFN